MYKYRVLGCQDGLYPLEDKETYNIRLVSEKTLIPLVQQNEVLNATYNGSLMINGLVHVYLTKENGRWYAEFNNEDRSRFHTSHVKGWEMGATYTEIKRFAKEKYGLVLPAIDDLRLIKQTRYRKIYEI